MTDEPAAVHVARADIVTNSGHVRPIDAGLVRLMRATAVVPLMFETWEIQAGRFSTWICPRCSGAASPGQARTSDTPRSTSYLDRGTMAIRLLTDARYAVHGARVVVLCDNPFAPYLADSLAGVGASPYVAASLEDVPDAFDPDVVLVALRPRDGSVLSTTEAERMRRRCPATLVAQFWGDLDRRRAARRLGLRHWPLDGTASRAHGGPAVGHRARAGRPAPGWRAEGRLRAASAARAAQRLRQELPR